MSPRFVRVAPERDEPIEDEPVGLRIHHLSFDVLDEGAHLLDSAVQDEPRAPPADKGG